AVETVGEGETPVATAMPDNDMHIGHHLAAVADNEGGNAAARRNGKSDTPGAMRPSRVQGKRRRVLDEAVDGDKPLVRRGKPFADRRGVRGGSDTTKQHR